MNFAICYFVFVIQKIVVLLWSLTSLNIKKTRRYRRHIVLRSLRGYV
nr:MAG TPA: hypothetical protein [Bacteriophage sp.]